MATVSNSAQPQLLTASARAVACPSITGMSLALVGNSFNVSWTGFSNLDKLKVVDFSSYSITLGANMAAVFTNVIQPASTINLGNNTLIDLSFAENAFHFSFSGDSTVVPSSGSFSFSAEVSTTCGLKGTYTLSIDNNTVSGFSGTNLTVSASTEHCPEPFNFTGFSTTWKDTGLVGFTVAWTGIINPDHVAPKPIKLTYTSGLDGAIDSLAASASSIDFNNGASASALLVEGAIIITFTPAAGNVMPSDGSFLIGVTLKSNAQCDKEAVYTASSESTLAAASGSLLVTLHTPECPVLAVFSGVAVTTQVVAGKLSFVFSWTGFENDDSMLLTSAFSFSSLEDASDAFDLSTAADVLFTDASDDSDIADIASVTVQKDAYIVSFAPTVQTPMPAQGRVTLTPKINATAKCGTTSAFVLKSGSESAVALQPSAADSLFVTYISKSCPAIFTGLEIKSNVAALVSNTRFVVSWTDYSNDDNLELIEAFTIARSDPSHTNPFVGLTASTQPVQDGTGANVNGATATLSYDTLTGSITVSFTLEFGVDFPAQGSFAVLPTLDSTFACDSVSAFALTANAAVVTAPTPVALAADFHAAVCTTVTGVQVTQTSATASTLMLALSYAAFKQGAAAGKITLSSTGITNLYSNNTALFINVTAQDSSVITVTGSVENGVVTIPLSSQLPTAAAVMQISLQLAVTSDCDLTTSLIPGTMGDISMSLATGFDSLVTPGFACTFDWRCTGASAGLTCVSTDDSQFSSTCSTNCGDGTRSNAPYCARFNNGQYKDAANDEKCPGNAKPTLTKDCSVYTCPNAMWKCYASGANGNTMIPCTNDSGYASCAHNSGCHTNPAVQRVAVCVADSSSTADIANHCPAAVASSKPAETKACASSLDKCDAQLDDEAECSINNQVVKCGIATRPGVCINSVTSTGVDSALCTEASLPLTQTCANIPTDCDFPAGWVSDQSECVTSTAPLCKSIRTQTSKCAFVNAENKEVAAAAYTCVGLSKPPAFVDCKKPAVACAAGRGTCTGFQSFQVEGEEQKNVLATCVCGAEFFDASCSTAIALSELTATWNASTRSIDVAWATNAASVAGAKVTVRVTPPGYLVALNTVEVAIGTLVASVSAAEHKLSPGTHTVTVFFSTSVSVSTTVVVGLLCDAETGKAHSCANGGTCNESTGECACTGAWTGDYCSVSPCESAACNTANAKNPSCLVVDNQAKCNCLMAEDGTALFRDALCTEAIDTTCAGLMCANGGTPLALYNESSNAVECTNTCTCPENSPFTGILCDTCRDSCYADGTVGSISGQCKCTCKAGYTDKECRCRYVNLRLVFPRSALPFLGKSNEAAQLAVWSAAIKADLQSLGGKSSLIYTVASVSSGSTKKGNFVNVLINVGPNCSLKEQKAFALPVAFSALAALSHPVSVSRFTAQAVVDMAETYAAVKTIADSISSGQTSTTTTLSAAVATNVGISDDACALSCADVPKGTGTGVVEVDTDADGGSSTSGSGNNDDDIIIGVVVGVGGFLIIAAIVFFAWYKKLCCFAGSSGASAADKNAGIEMAETNYDI